MTLSIIVAVAANNAIGKDNDLLWHLPGDLKRFKETTTGHAIIMGKNTFHSLPNGALPNRRNIVVSSTLVPPDGVERYSTLQAALEAVAGEEEVFIIGGAQLYAAALPLADKIYFSRVEKGFPRQIPISRSSTLQSGLPLTALDIPKTNATNMLLHLQYINVLPTLIID